MSSHSATTDEPCAERHLRRGGDRRMFGSSAGSQDPEGAKGLGDQQPGCVPSVSLSGDHAGAGADSMAFGDEGAAAGLEVVDGELDRGGVGARGYGGAGGVGEGCVQKGGDGAVGLHEIRV